MKRFINNQKEELLSYVGRYAIDKFGKSDFAKENLNIFAMSVISSIIKSIVSFLLLYRLQTNYLIINFILSMFVTMVCAFVSPVFFLFVKLHEKDLVKLSNHILDRATQHDGVLFLLHIRNMTVIAVSLFVIIFCLLVEVTSAYIIHTVIEFLVGFWVVDKVNLFREGLFTPVKSNHKLTNEPVVIPFQLTKYDFVKIIITPKKARVAFTRQPTRAKLINIKKKDVAPPPKSKKTLLGGSKLMIMEDWEQL